MSAANEPQKVTSPSPSSDSSTALRAVTENPTGVLLRKLAEKGLAPTRVAIATGELLTEPTVLLTGTITIHSMLPKIEFELVYDSTTAELVPVFRDEVSEIRLRITKAGLAAEHRARATGRRESTSFLAHSREYLLR